MSNGSKVENRETEVERVVPNAPARHGETVDLARNKNVLRLIDD